VLLNANMRKKEEFHLPEGKWDILVNKDYAGIEVLGSVMRKVILESSTGLLLRKN
jgi:hypothetical protein